MARIVLIVFTFLMACGDRAKEVVKKKGRPEPIECATTGNRQVTCVDGAGLIWVCGYVQGADDECIQVGQRLPEAR